MRRNCLQYGVTLLEALIAMLVLALGMMSFTAVDARLRIAADIAKQRAEAVRIAQEDIENFRAFGTLTVNAAIPNNLAYSNIVNLAASKAVLASSVVTTTNATFTITRSIIDSPGGKMKDLRVQVGWNDRNGTAQQIVLRSVIAGVDPILAAALTIAPSGTPVRDPLRRDVIVPIPAKDLGDGTSVFKPVSDGGRAFIFDNITGDITGSCDVASGIFTVSITSGDLSNCSAQVGYLLTGFIRFSYSVSNGRPDATNPNDPPPGTPPSTWSVRLDLNGSPPPANAQGIASLLTVGAWPPVTGSVGNTAGYATPECASESLKTIFYTTTASTAQVALIVPASVPASPTPSDIAPYAGVSAANIVTVIIPNPIERYVRYTCVIYPIDLDSDAATPKAWTGRATLVPTGTFPLGTASGTWKVCRYSSDYNLNGYVSLPPPPYSAGSTTPITKIDNPEHPYAYLNVTSGLTNQNYLIINGNQNCPTDGDVEVDGRGNENYTNETTVLHQP